MTAAGPSNAPTRTAADTGAQARSNSRPADTALGARLRKIRWGVRAALAVGVAASVAANILHADPHPVSQVIAAWPPLALALTVELISRVPVHRRTLAAVRLLATAAIASIAAWVSYFHMVGVVSRYGETGTVPYLLPLSVDGLVIVASISLVELAGRIQDSETHTGDLLLSTAGSRSVDVSAEPARSVAAHRTGVPVPMVDLQHADNSRPVNGAAPVPASSPRAERLDGLHDRARAGIPPSVEPHYLAGAAGNLVDDTPPSPGLTNGASHSVDGSPVPPAAPQPAGSESATAVRDHVDEPPLSSADADRPTAGEQPAGGQPPPEAVSDEGEDDDRADSPAEDDMPATAAAIAAWLRSDPSLQPADIAVKIDRSVRTVRRHWKLAMAQARAVASPPSTGADEVIRAQATVPEAPGEPRR